MALDAYNFATAANLKSERLMSLRDRLKTETLSAHQRLEARLDLLRPDFGRSDLIRLLERFYGYYHPCEEQIGHLPQTVQTWLADRLKTPLLAADLKFFGYTDQSLTALPRCPVTGSGFGSTYMSAGWLSSV